MTEFKPSDFQVKILDEIKHGTGNILVEAVAGSGKTKTIEMSLNVVPTTAKVIFLAYNKHIAEELRKRAPYFVHVSTFHSLGLRTIISAIGKVEVDSRKQKDIIKDILQEDLKTRTIKPQEEYNLRLVLNKLLPLYKATLLEVTPENSEYLVIRYNIDMNVDVVDFDQVTHYAKRSLRLAKEITGSADFDDMIWFPLIHNLPLPKYDFVFVDEAQDLNAAQIEIALRIIKDKTGRIITVGDRAQSIYGFRAADTEAIPHIIERTKSKILPLSITYRCPKSHVRLAKEFVPQIEAAPWAEEGTLKEITTKTLSTHIKPNDMIICRYNAPLIPIALELLGQGIKVVIKGKDIGEGLLKLTEKFTSTHPNVDDLRYFYIWLQEWKDKELKMAAERKQGSRMERAIDTADVFLALGNNLSTLTSLQRRIYDMFSDEQSAITLSSIHRAKGLEADRVFFLLPDTIPSKYATTEHEMQQEYNCKYIALTRSKSDLYLVYDR